MSREQLPGHAHHAIARTTSDRGIHWVALALIGAALTMPFGVANAQYANLDYYNPGTTTDEKARFVNVHLYHLQQAIDEMKAGNLGPAHADLEFILRTYPNSPRALNAISELCEVKWKSPKCDADSWLDKAVDVNPSIATTWVLYGIHLERKKRPREAIEKFKRALELNPNDINAHYNLGLAFFGLKEYEKANEQAQASYALGAPLPGLRDKLKRAGAWKPDATSTSDAASESPTPAKASIPARKGN